MPRKKGTAGQYSMDDYRLKQVDIRLKLMEGPSYYSQTPLTSPEGAAAVMRDGGAILLQPDAAHKSGRRSGSHAGCAEGA